MADPAPRHALPRTPALARLRLPLGRALVLTALPTALVLGSQRPPTVDTTTATAHSVAEEVADDGVNCAHSDAPTPAPAPSAAPRASAVGEAVEPPEHTADEEASPAPTPSASPPSSPSTPSPTPSSPSAAPSPDSDSTGLAGLLGILGLRDTRGDTGETGNTGDTAGDPHVDTEQPSPVLSPAPPSVAPAQPAATPSAPPSPVPHATATPSTPPRKTDRTCDISTLPAPEDTSAGRFAAESWTLKSSRLELRDAVFGGVVTVDTATGPKRVLKFSAEAVTIRDLKMSVPVGPQVQHIDGAPGSTSTLGGGRVTMYVESLTGTLSAAEGIPLPPALRLHLTPDSVPEWLYDTLGKLGLRLQLTLDDADIDQAGQTGGKLVIPGIHGYGTTP